MEACSMYLCFQLKDDPINNTGLWERLMKLVGEITTNSRTPTCVDLPTGDKILVTTTTDDSHCTIHVYTHGLVTIDIQAISTPEQSHQLTEQPIAYAKGKELEKQIKEAFGEQCAYTRSLPAAIVRGRLSPYFVDSDGVLYEYSDLELVHEENSKWQNIKIYSSPEFGNILVLDDDIMIGESDDIYTQTILGLDQNNFRDKTVLILGGGDGGLLCELLKRKPRHVLMVENETVLTICRQHMRKLCGDVLDQMSGERYEIRVDNCLSVLQSCQLSGEKFDYVINDLSEYLIDMGTGHIDDFKTEASILQLSAAVLKKGGKLLSRGGGNLREESIDKMVEDIEALGLAYEKRVVDIPSFKEPYCFFEIWKPIAK